MDAEIVPIMMERTYRDMKLVAAAIIISHGKVLIAQRAQGLRLAGKWEFPGGKVEPGETPEECLKREIREELGIEIAVDGFFGESVYHYDIGPIRLLAYKASWTGGDLRLTEHEQIKWVKPEKLDDYDFSPADLPFIEKLKKEAL